MSLTVVMPEKLLLTEGEAAALLGFSRRYLQGKRLDGDGPTYVKLGGGAKNGPVRYRPQDLERWIEAHQRRNSTSGE